MDEYRLRSVYDLQNSQVEKESYLRELLRMQKLDHIRVQISNDPKLSPHTKHS